MLMLVDSPGLWYRSFFGMPSSMKSPDGEPVNAVRGFIDGLAVLIRTRQPQGLVCALDNDWRPAWRVDLIPEYKAQRVAVDGTEDEPDALGPQVKVIMDVLDAVGFTTIGADDYEADDVMATLAAKADGPVEVVTGDRDLFQVIDDDALVKVVYIGRGVVKAEVFDDAAVYAKYGVHANRYVDYAVLRGDPSDGLRGVKGIGDKTAAKLVTEYGGLPGILDAAADTSTMVTPRIRSAITLAGRYLRRAPSVVTTVRTVPVSVGNAGLPSRPRDPERLDELTRRFGIDSPIKRLVKALAW